MTERAELLGGWLRVLSSPGKGTHLQFDLPARDAMKILVVDHHVVMREGLCLLIESLGLEMAGQCGRASECLELLEKSRFDVFCWTYCCLIGTGGHCQTGPGPGLRRLEAQEPNSPC